LSKIPSFFNTRDCSELHGDQSLGQQELQHGAAEGFAELQGVVDGKEEEATIGGEPTFQDDGVPVGVRSQEIAEGLESHDC
jgi:hypothetical protein